MTDQIVLKASLTYETSLAYGTGFTIY